MVRLSEGRERRRAVDDSKHDSLLVVAVETVRLTCRARAIAPLFELIQRQSLDLTHFPLALLYYLTHLLVTRLNREPISTRLDARCTFTHFYFTIWITVGKLGFETKARSAKRNGDRFERSRNRITIILIYHRMAKSRVPMRVVVRIPPGHLVGSVLVPRRLGTRLNRTQPPIAITRETINVLEGGERRRTPQREGERHFSLSLRAAFPTFFPFSLSLSLSFTATFRSFVLASKSLVYLSYI